MDAPANNIMNFCCFVVRTEQFFSIDFENNNNNVDGVKVKVKIIREKCIREIFRETLIENISPEYSQFVHIYMKVLFNYI